jgi:hypothetical protein
MYSRSAWSAASRPAAVALHPDDAALGLAELERSHWYAAYAVTQSMCYSTESLCVQSRELAERLVARFSEDMASPDWHVGVESEVLSRLDPDLCLAGLTAATLHGKAVLLLLAHRQATRKHHTSTTTGLTGDGPVYLDKWQSRLAGRGRTVSAPAGTHADA